MKLGRSAVLLVGLATGAALVAIPAPVVAQAARPVVLLTGCHEGIQVQPPPEGQHWLAAVQFVSASTGWVVGGSRIFATGDGGAHWVTQRRAHNADYSSINAIDASHAWVVGRNSLLRTTNGGRTWHALPDPCPRINSVHFIGPRLGYAIAGTSLLRTSDGGRHWHVMSAPGRAQSVCFTDTSRGWLGAHGAVYRTVDGGRTWSRAVRSVQTHVHPTADTFEAFVQCAGPDDGWAELVGGAAASQEAHVGFHLSDAGSQPVFSEGYFPYRGVGRLPASPGGYVGGFSALDASSAVYIDNCVACGWGTVTMGLASNGGSTFRDVGRVTHLRFLTDASFTSSAEGWGIGWFRRANLNHESWRIVRTIDGGHSWQVQLRR